MEASTSLPRANEQKWLYLGYAVIVLTLLARWLYIAYGPIGLSEDEAYQWLWSKHPALSYFSKPPGIAYIQMAGTAIGGDTDLGVRLFSPVFAAVLSFFVMRFLARYTDSRTAFWMLLVPLATPLLVFGSILMTIDPPFVLCWMWAILAGWRALQPDGKTVHWLIVGFAMALGVLCKQNELYQLFCWGIFFVLYSPARVHLRKPGPWLALFITLLGMLPQIIWNAQNGWATLHHVADNAGMTHKWHFNLSFLTDFIGAEFGLFNPVFFIASLWAAIAFWKRRQEKPLWLFLFCMSVPVLLGHILYAFHSRILPNWIAPTVPPLFCLMALYWHEHQHVGKRLLYAGLILGLIISPLLYDLDFIGLFVHKLPGDLDPSRRLGRGYREAAALVEEERMKFGTNTFIIADRYGTAGLYTFYSPIAAAAARAHEPIVYCVDANRPVNQFYFWPEYKYLQTRRGQDALYVRRRDPYKPEHGWFSKWWKGEPVGYRDVPPPAPAPASITSHFETVTNLGVFEVKLSDRRVYQRVEIYACHGLK